ncbi:MAG TPA: hypothetical protein ENJ65_00160 [Candidatus Tenderia electrophaga]|uniref:Cytochrome c-type biogenesis protein H Ig-like domain-containing protein n=1 Tax=Candidatus Tenderia electrophaga TaxID=1748243 RepID=A0A832N2K0_9GAMM|nr:hypothetical protein [Candidatus Tenderia electrophaga]
MPPGSEDIEVMHANITEAKSYLERQQAGEFGQAPAQQHLSDVATTAKAAVTAQVKGRVSIAADLAGKFADNDTLFIFARAANGPPMPLAIIRATASELPLEFSLDEGMAMMPSMSLAKFSEVVVGARISKTGNAMPQSGDLQGATAAVAVGSEGLEIVIDTVVP